MLLAAEIWGIWGERVTGEKSGCPVIGWQWMGEVYSRQMAVINPYSSALIF